MITIPELVSQALGSFLTTETKDRFGASHSGLTELLPFAAKLTLECIGNSDALYHDIEHTMLVPSRPREFHPEPLTDPDLILSHHPARTID
jgi:hypothetical protein